MASFQWRRGRFFDIDKGEWSVSEDGEFGDDNFITCASSGAGFIVLGDQRVRKKPKKYFIEINNQ